MPIDWMPTEPDNKNNDEDCILFVANGTIADVSCNELHPYMCYKKKTKSMINRKVGSLQTTLKDRSINTICFLLEITITIFSVQIKAFQTSVY